MGGGMGADPGAEMVVGLLPVGPGGGGGLDGRGWSPVVISIERAEDVDDVGAGGRGGDGEVVEDEF